MNRTFLGLFFHCLCFVSFYSFAEESSDPVSVYLTWQQSPETTMTVCWITFRNNDSDEIQYKSLTNKNWKCTAGSHVVFPETNKYLIHSAEIIGLRPETDYCFRLAGHQKIYQFRTMPNRAEKPIRFVVGGDMYHDTPALLEEMNRTAAKVDPLFVLIGGDIAYAAPYFKTSSQDIPRWIDWLSIWSQTMTAPNGRLIPLIPAIGNHEVSGRYNQTPAQAPVFYALFPMPGKQGYNVLDFGSYMSILMLDTNHTHPIEGAQTDWIKKTLEERADIPNKFALYHVPAYPSVRDSRSFLSALIRRKWVPLFDRYGLTTAFEHHDHAYKRTRLLKQNKVDPQGVLYIGDGAWGVKKPRIPNSPAKVFYLEKSLSSRNFIVVTLHEGKRSYTAVDETGKIIDSFEH